MNRGESKAYEYFQQVCRIPRKSGDEEEISDFLIDFAKERGLESERDQENNVLIRKPSTIPGYKGAAVIIQGHMDMVYEKTPDSAHNYKDGIHISISDGFLSSADKTSLGADNGAALAYAMRLLDRKDIPLPDLEVLITTGEEVGLRGVKNLGIGDVKGKFLINLDAEEEGVFFTSCAGGVRTKISLPLKYETIRNAVQISLTVNGVSGGHSGLDIGRGRANAVKILGQILYEIDGLAKVADLDSPGQANAIASKGAMRCYVPEKEAASLVRRLRGLERQLKEEYGGTDHISFSILQDQGEACGAAVYSDETARSIMRIITFLPCGVISYRKDDPSMVQTSSNIGTISVDGDKICFLSSSRSSVRRQKEEIKNTMKIIADTFGAECEFYGEYPQWEYKEDSKLREICGKVYKRYSGREAVFTGIHAGVECGFLAEKLGEDIDMISCGVSLVDVHTPRERMSLQSFYNTEEILTEILREISMLQGL